MPCLFWQELRIAPSSIAHHIRTAQQIPLQKSIRIINIDDGTIQFYNTSLQRCSNKVTIQYMFVNTVANCCIATLLAEESCKKFTNNIKSLFSRETLELQQTRQEEGYDLETDSVWKKLKDAQLCKWHTIAMKFCLWPAGERIDKHQCQLFASKSHHAGQQSQWNLTETQFCLST